MNEIEKAIKLLNDDQVVGMPTETVYGLAASIDSKDGLNKIFKTKERPFFDPLIIHVSSIEMAKPLVKEWSPLAQKLADIFWPGPMTIVLKKSEKVSDLITSGLDSVGIRFPKHQIAQDLISQFGVPLAAPSANKFTKTSPTTKEHVISEFGDEVFVLEGGACDVGIESTVMGIFEKEIKIYRPGMITKEDIKNVLNDESINIQYVESPVAPGQLNHHYMPNKPVILTNKQPTDKDVAVWCVPDSPVIASRELYSKLREMDSSDSEKIYIVLKDSFKKSDDWSGILNRLSKAKSEDFYF